MKHLGRMVVLVHDYDEALRFYCGTLGFEKFVDVEAGKHRFVHVRLAAQPEFGIWLLKAEDDEDRARVGKQTGRQPLAVLYTEDLIADAARLQGQGVVFHVPPREEPDALVGHFRDLYGNEFVLVQLKKKEVPA